MMNYLIDVPVKINVWIRVDLFRKQFDIIKIAKPSIIFVQSDGGRNPDEWESINKNRRIIDEEIDWACSVYKIYMEENHGLYSMERIVREYIWDKVEYCIFLEDDDIPSVSFFGFCKALLEKYKNDYRIQGICGFNPLGVCDDVNDDYFFSAMSNPWGTARWKRSDDVMFDEDICFKSDKRIMKIIKKVGGRQTYNMTKQCIKTSKINGHVPWIEYFNGIGRITQNALFIFPKKNLISNEGCTDDAEHASSYKYLTKKEKALFKSKTYELDFPLSEPRYVISDVLFQKKVRNLIGSGKPHVILYRRIVKALKFMFSRGPKALIIILKKRFNKSEK